MDARKVFAGSLLAAGVIGLGTIGYYLGRRQGVFGRATGRSMGWSNPDNNLVTSDGKRPPVVSQIKIDGRTVTHYRANDIPINDRVKLIQDRVYGSVQDPRIRELAIKLIKECRSRDNMCEAKAIYEAVRKNVRYIGDVAPVKFPDGSVEPIDFFQHAWRTWTMGAGDCLPLSTLVLRDDYETVPLAALNPGDRIWDGKAWTVIQDRWLTGVKPLIAVELSNGCVLRCTAEHKLFRDVDGRVEEVRAGDVQVGDCLLPSDQVDVAGVDGHAWPEAISQLSSEELSWLLGVYIADGWHEDNRLAISGRDGKPKEEQKRRVLAMMDGASIATRWHHKYLAINDRTLAAFFAQVGSRAWDKQVPSLQLATQADVRALLEGLAADASNCGRRSDIRVYGTTSPALALQLRILHCMLGESVHIRRVDDHGGFGEHPIYRVTVRDPNNARRDIRFSRVRAIRDGGADLCADITTSTGRFWLPESDTIVHNCDDHVALVASLWSVVGIPARLRVTAPTRSSDWGHIYPVAGFPVIAPRKWIAGDTTLEPPTRFGAEARYARNLDYQPGHKPHTRDLPA